MAMKMLRRGVKPLLILFAALVLCSAMASAATVVQIVPTSKTVEQGEAFTVNIEVIPDRALRGVQVDLSYGSSLLSCSASDGGMFDNFQPPVITSGTLGQMAGYQMPTQATVSTTGDLAVVSFTASSANTGTTTLDLSSVKVKDENGIELPASDVTVIDGSVTVEEAVVSTKTIVKIVPTSKTVDQGDTFTVDIQVIPDRPLRGVQVDLSYSSSLLSCSASDGGMFDNFQPPVITSGTLGQMAGYQMPTQATVSTTGDLAVVSFTASSANTGTTTLDLSSVKVKDENGIELPASDVTVIDGSVTVEEAVVSTKTIVKIVPTSKTVDQGDTFTVDIEVIPDRPLRGVQVDLSYSSSLLSCSASDGGMFDNFQPPVITPGTLSQMAGYQMPTQATVSTTGDLAVVSFTASSANTGTTTLDLSSVKVKDENGIELPASDVTVIDGSVTVEEVADGPPRPRITSPADESTVSGTAVPIVAVDDSSEGDIAYALFEYYNDSNCNCAADDGNAWVEIGNDTSSTGGWSAVWNTTAIPDCCHIIKVTMGDGIGQTGSDQINVAVSNHDPMPNITAPSDGDVLNGSVIINAVDESFESGADIAYCLFEYYYDENCNCTPDDGNVWVEILNDTDPDCGWSAEWDTLIDGVAAYPNGCYMIRATMGDMHGRTGSDEINVDLSNPDFCLELKTGLNLVSIPKAIIGPIGPDYANTVFNLDPYAGEYCLYYRADMKHYVTNPIVKPCRGYWIVNKTGPATVCVYFDDAAPPPTQPLREGWNMIGHIRTTPMPIYVAGSDADFGSITGLENPEGTKLYKQIATYHGTWTDYPVGTLEEMTPGWGYWISMKQNATMSGSWV